MSREDKEEGEKKGIRWVEQVLSMMAVLDCKYTRVIKRNNPLCSKCFLALVALAQQSELLSYSCMGLYFSPGSAFEEDDPQKS